MSFSETNKPAGPSSFDLLAFDHNGCINATGELYNSENKISISLTKNLVQIDHVQMRQLIDQNRVPLVTVQEGQLLLANFKIILEKYDAAQDAAFLLVQYLDKDNNMQYFTGISAYGYTGVGLEEWTGIKLATWVRFIGFLHRHRPIAILHTAYLEWVGKVQKNNPRNFGVRNIQYKDNVIALADQSKVIEAEYKEIKDELTIENISSLEDSTIESIDLEGDNQDQIDVEPMPMSGSLEADPKKDNHTDYQDSEEERLQRMGESHGYCH